MKNGYYTTKLISEKEFSEIDMVLYAKLFGNNWDEKFERLIEIGNFNGNNGILIDTLIKQLTAFKKKDCTHVSIEYHVDHIGYELSGLSVAKSTVNEIKEYNRIEQEKLAIQKQVEALDTTREQLVKKYKSIK